MIPLVFSGTIGRLHLPKGRPSGLGVVVVPPHGLEALAAARALRTFADLLADAGHAVLRFDLPGTGDALGSDADPARIEAWTDGIVAAAGTLAREAGIDRIVIAGHRFGGLLATRALPRIGGLAGLVLIDPVTRGRLYARELGMTARAVAEGGRLDPEATATPQGVLVGGWLTSTETLEAMRALDLSRLPAPTVPSLILHRRGMADAVALGEAWTAAGAGCTASEAPGLDGIGFSPTVAVTPSAAFSSAASWISALATDAAPQAAATAPSAAVPVQLEAETFIERPLMFGPSQRLFGILCAPKGPVSGSPPMLIINAGRNPHVGWARLGVDLARTLAAEGVASLRMDFSGIGDSDVRPGDADSLEDTTYHPDHLAEVGFGLDALAAEGFPRAALLGACSGAFTAFQAAAQEPRIAALVLVNTQRFVWREGETVAETVASGFAAASTYVAKIADARAWKRILTGERKLLPLVRELSVRVFARARSVVPGPETRRARRMMQDVLGRGVPVELVYSAGDAGFDELARHFGPSGRRLAREPGLAMTVIADADHDLSPAAARLSLTTRILAAMKQWQASRA